MKVISGKLKGRTIKGYDIDGTRPTMDRVKESIFSMIQDYIHDSMVLDLFSGSGNYGIECLSNGANKVYFNDKNKKCIQVIRDNLISFNCLDDNVLLNLDYYDALVYLKKQQLQFDLIFLDPPYKEEIINKIINIVLDKSLLKKNGLIICELTHREEYLNDNLVLWKERKYGEKGVLIYKLK